MKGPTWYKFDEDRGTLVFRRLIEGDNETLRDSWTVKQRMESTPAAGGAENAGESGEPQKPTVTKGRKRPACKGVKTGGGDGGNGGGGGTDPADPEENGEPEKKKPNRGNQPTAVTAKTLRAAEVEALKIINMHQCAVGSANSILAAVDSSSEEWDWLRAPNPKYEDLKLKVQTVSKTASTFCKQVLLNGNFTHVKKRMGKQELLTNMQAMVRDMQKPLEALARANKCISEMQDANLCA